MVISDDILHSVLLMCIIMIVLALNRVFAVGRSNIKRWANALLTGKRDCLIHGQCWPLFSPLLPLVYLLQIKHNYKLDKRRCFHCFHSSALAVNISQISHFLHTYLPLPCVFCSFSHSEITDLT